MVHAQHAVIALGAVMRARRLHTPTDTTPSEELIVDIVELVFTERNLLMKSRHVSLELVIIRI